MKFSGKNKKMTALIAAAIAVCVTGGAATAAYAYYVNKQLSQSNTISIGQTVETIVIGADSTSKNQELYPGDSATFTYSLEVENYAGSATVTTALSTGEADTNFDAAYFTVTYTVGEDQTVYSNDEPYMVTSADNGKNIVVTVTMNDEEPCYTFANMPTFSTVTLTVSLVEGEFGQTEPEQTEIADFVKDFSVESNDGAWKYGSAAYAWDGTQAIKNSGESESFTFAAATEKNSSSDGWTADGVEIKSGWINGNAAISYTFDSAVNADVAVSFQGQEEGTRMETRTIVVGSDGTAKTWEYKAQTGKDWNYTQSVQAAEGDVVYVIFFTATGNAGLAQGSLNIAITEAQA